MSARIDVCSAQGVCSMLATLTNTSGAAFGKFTIDNIDANNGLGMIPNSGVNLFTDTSTPIKITFFSSLSAPLTGNSNSIGVYYTRSSGSEFTSDEVAAATMPSVSNSGIITSPLNNPQLQWNSGSGVLSSIYVGSNDSSTYTNAQSLILSEGSGFTTLQITDTGSAIYRSIDMSSHIPNRPGMLETKYIWAPTCPGCY